jgi:catechol 2,3-dioxygenase-like lactoylglutathione lyase family enzyme
MDRGVRFYTDLLGFQVSDVVDYAARAKTPGQLAGLGDPKGYFTRYGTDHHALVLFNQRVREALGRAGQTGITINQITWQVGSMSEVGNAIQWFKRRGVNLERSGRDMPGSNWHTYLNDPDGHLNELYYGIEQIGWNGFSKPKAMYDRGFNAPPPLPQISEHQEVNDALARKIELFSGHRHIERLPATYDVDGILLPRPFKVVRLGPVSLFVKDLEAAESFYRHDLGFMLAEEVVWEGHRCLFLRVNTEHHALALFPLALREKVGLSRHSQCAALGLQVANYRQLKEAVRFLSERGVKFVEIPPQLHPGIDYAAHALDPDGHCIQFYFAMEQVGWDGKPRPQPLRKPLGIADWPETLDGDGSAYMGEPFLGPWG